MAKIWVKWLSSTIVKKMNKIFKAILKKNRIFYTNPYTDLFTILVLISLHLLNLTFVQNLRKSLKRVFLGKNKGQEEGMEDGLL